jgi:hypothetical protein
VPKEGPNIRPLNGRRSYEKFLEDMEKEFRKARKVLDTYLLQECDAAVKKR